MYYFAYGSNNPGQMADRTGHPVELLGLAKLPDSTFLYQGRSAKWMCGTANVVSSTGSVVYGVLYNVTEEDLEKLDPFEAVKVADDGQQVGRYMRVSADVLVVETGLRVRASMYVMTGYSLIDRQIYPPSPEYVQAVVRSALAGGFPKDYISEKLIPQVVLEPVFAPGYDV